MNGAEIHRKLHRIARVAVLVGVAGIAGCVLGVYLNPAEFLHAYLWSYLFILGIALGSSAVLMVFYLTGGKWGEAIQRLLEAATRTLPMITLLVLPILFGVRSLYLWARPEELARDPQLQKKAPYLNPTFFIGRAVLYFAIWLLWSWMLNRYSRERDRTGDPAMKSRLSAISGPGLIIYGLTMSFAAIDWVMSLEPHWFSTIYGAMYLVGQVLSALAVATVAVLLLAEYDALPEVVSVKAIHDLGNLLLTFVVLWAYVAFSQLLITWSGNLPHEITWYYRRFGGGWQWLGLVLIVFHFFAPFFLLLARTMKKRRRPLAIIAGWLILMRLVDLYWMIEPSFNAEGFHVHWLDFATLAALGGMWLSLYIRQVRTGPLLPASEPVPLERA